MTTTHYHVVYRLLFLAALAVAVGAVSYAIASTPSREASRLGMRGLKRRQAIATNPGWALLEPLIRWFGVRVSGLIPETYRTRIDAQLTLSGDYLGLTPEEYLSLSIVSSLACIAAGIVAGALSGFGPPLAIMTGLLGTLLPYFKVTSEIERRSKQVNRGLPQAADVLALAMTAGQDFVGAVRQVVEKSSDPTDALIEEFTRILQELQLGQTRKYALTSFYARVPTEAVGEFVGSIVQAEERGSPIAGVLQIQAGVSRARRSVRAEELAARAGVMLLGPLVLLVLAIMLIVLGPMAIKIAETF